MWESLRRVLAIDPNRSNGVPLNPHYRNPPPGSNDPMTYDDPVTLPAGDIAGNPYWQRDSRRSYPRLSAVTQKDAVALLTVGSEAAPKAELVGEAGAKAVVEAQTEGDKGLASFLQQKRIGEEVLVNGMPPLPSGQSLGRGEWDVHKYELTEEQAYGEQK